MLHPEGTMERRQRGPGVMTTDSRISASVNVMALSKQELMKMVWNWEGLAKHSDVWHRAGVIFECRSAPRRGLLRFSRVQAQTSCRRLLEPMEQRSHRHCCLHRTDHLRSTRVVERYHIEPSG